MDLNKINKSMKYYEVECTKDNPILCEDGEYRVRPGYVVRNKTTDVIEHTTMLLAGAIFQAQHFDNTLESLLAAEEPKMETLLDMPVEDVVAN